jgi:uridine kinase
MKVLRKLVLPTLGAAAAIVAGGSSNAATFSEITPVPISGPVSLPLVPIVEPFLADSPAPVDAYSVQALKPENQEKMGLIIERGVAAGAVAARARREEMRTPDALIPHFDRVLSSVSLDELRDEGKFAVVLSRLWDGASVSAYEGLVAQARTEIAPHFTDGLHLTRSQAAEGAAEVTRQAVERARRLPGRSVIFLQAPTAAGKSTLARELSGALGSRMRLFHVDRYFHNLAEMPRGQDGNPDFDQPTSLQLDRAGRDVKTLLSGGTIELPQYDWKSVTSRSDTGEFMALAPEDILVIDSIYASHDSLLASAAGHAALNIFIDAPTIVRLKRRLKRDRVERSLPVAANLGWWGNILHDEAAFVHPLRRYADLVLGSFSPEELRSLPEEFARLLADEWAAGGKDPSLTENLKRRISQSLEADRGHAADSSSR